MYKIYNVGRNVRGMHSGMMQRGYGCELAMVNIRACAGYGDQLIGIISRSGQARVSCRANSLLFASLFYLAMAESPQQGSSTEDADQRTEQMPFIPKQLAWMDRLIVSTDATKNEE